MPSRVVRARHKAMGFMLVTLLGGALGMRGGAAPTAGTALQAPHDSVIDATRLPAACANSRYAVRGGHAAPTMAGGEGAPFVAPPNPDGATLVDIGLDVLEITALDESENTFDMEGALDVVWCDPREAFDADGAGAARESFLEGDALSRLHRMWWPDLALVNEEHAREREDEELTIHADGTVEYHERFVATLATDYDLRRFPFDTQTLVVEIESFAWPSDVLRLHVDDAAVGFSREFRIPEWSVVGLQEQVADRQEYRGRAPRSQLLSRITVRRDPGYHLTKIMIPLGVIVAISWAVFWMIGDGLADRMSVSFTGVLTAVAYQFIVGEIQPRRVYDTYLDAMVLLSFLMMVLTIIENIVVNTLYLRERQGAADRIDRTSRWLFPVLYFGGLGLLALIYLG